MILNISKNLIIISYCCYSNSLHNGNPNMITMLQANSFIYALRIHSYAENFNINIALLWILPLSTCQAVKLSSCQAVNLPSCQAVKLILHNKQVDYIMSSTSRVRKQRKELLLPEGTLVLS